MKINTDLIFIIKPSSTWDNSYTPSVKKKIITTHDNQGTGATYG